MTASPQTSAPLDPTDSSAVRARLDALEAALREALTLGAEATEAVELDQTRQGRLSRQDALQQQAMAQATERRRRQELQRVGAALDRLAAGAYGACVSCGEEIDPRRLGLDPAVATCIACARKA